jgi:nucleotide-binding universal stress UspA family protein
MSVEANMGLIYMPSVMRYMYHVLVPVDTDESRAQAQLDAVIELPNPEETLRVDLLYVYEEIDAPGDEAGTTYIDEINQNLESLPGLPETITFLTSQLQEAGVTTAVHDVTGEPAPAILELADEFDVDAIVLGARRRSPVGKAVFGSVTQRVILSGDHTVIVARA